MDLFNDLFGKKPTLKEQQRDNDRALRRAGRDIERERHKLENEEKKLELEIKKAAKEGNKDACTLLAKQLVQLRKQKNRTYAANSKISSVGMQNKTMGANIALAGAMKTTTKTMADMNKIMRPEAIAGDMKAFQMANMKMEMTDEMINDTLDDMLTESGDESESDQIVSQVLDEIGIEISGKMSNAPTLTDTIGNASKEKDIEAQLARLRTT
ncbi:charged multivesicular body protein 2b-B-like [Bradysia coprophila]|uniref:charged multivesicular body protein 2b-B-like n=1 Tax=Bradysia coprophila TaxID=38358 RepID=UPI00187D8B1F|nr:charged multivesicular body protein 2b-B-like [Bradysia coprophila]